MSVIFRGRFEAKLDPKSRFSLPAAFREDLAKNDNQFVVTNSQYRNRRCLDVYTFSAWQALEKRIAKMPQLKAEVQAFQRFYLASGQVLELDSANRLLLPSTLKKYSNLDSQIVLVGMGEKFEIWSAETWGELHENLAQNFDDILAAVSSYSEDEE